MIEFGVRVRNVGTEPIPIHYGIPESTPTVTDAQGEKIHVVMPPLLGIPTEKVLRPGETAGLYHRKLAVEAVATKEAERKAHVGTPTIRVRAGTYKITLPEFVTRVLVLSTGELEFEVTDGDEDKRPEREEPFTAWGKAVGAGYKPAWASSQARSGHTPGARR